MQNKTAIISYVPVIHEGYFKFLKENSQGADLYILGKAFSKEFPWMKKEIRALDPEVAREIIERFDLFQKVEIIKPGDIEKLKKDYNQFILPDEEITRKINADYSLNGKLKKTFLMWDKHNSTEAQKVVPGVEISKEEFDQKILKLTAEEAEKVVIGGED